MSDLRSLKILHAALSLECGGLEHLIVAMCNYAQHEGESPEVVCLEREGTLSRSVLDDAIPVHCVSKRPGLHYWLTQSKVTHLLKQVNPDIVHTHQIGVLLHVGRAARKLGIPVLHTEHGKHYESSVKRRCLGRVAARTASSFVCVSNDIAASVRRWHIANERLLEVVPNGIDIEPFSTETGGAEIRSALSIPVSAFVVGTVGRLSEVKRQDLLIRAFSKLSTSIADAHLLIVGDGECRSILEALVSELRLTDRVHLVGYRQDRQRYLNAMDVFALTSSSEGMPLAILEAWAAKRAVVASDVGGIPNIVESHVNGMLYPSGDQTALVACLKNLSCDSGLRAKLVARAYSEVCQKYSLSTMMLSYRKVYQRIQRHYITHAHPR